MSVGQDDNLDLHILLTDILGRLRINDEWSTYLVIEDEDEDSDKSFVVTVDYEWILQSIYVDYTSSADAGNRQLTVEIQDTTPDVVAVIKTGIVQAASLQRYYQFAPQLPDLTAFRDTSYLSTPLPDIILDEGYTVRVYDSAAIAAAADDMLVYIIVKRRPKES